MKPKFIDDYSLRKLRNRRFQNKMRTERAEEFRGIKQDDERDGKRTGGTTFKDWLKCKGQP